MGLKTDVIASEKNICLSCGFCCDGTIYSYVSLQETDNPVELRNSGLPIKTSERDVSKSQEKESGFDQPCAAHQSCACTIYQSRPAICKEYKCALLKAYEAQEASTEAALKLIGNCTRLRDKLRSTLETHLSVDAGLPLLRLFQLMAKKLAATKPHQQEPDMVEIQLDMATLRILIARRFDPMGDQLAKHNRGAANSQ